MFPAPVVLVGDHAAAIAAVGVGRPVTLLSPPGAAGRLGALWWWVLAEAARARASAPVADLLDCADAPGHAMAALRCGCRGLVLARGPGFARVAAAAASLGAEVLDSRPPAMTILDWRAGDARAAPR
ncbi:MAG: hypothetical protein KGK10_03635 [Rhodospirillales bacterium]|nr:hypothetical protein [Rhodospirillales bacterium]